MTFQRILCPIDFSAGSQHAMAVAVRLATEADAELVLAHAWYVAAPAFPMDYSFSPQLVQQLGDDAQRGLDAAVQEATALGAKRVSARLLSGVAWSAIGEVLDDPSFDLVVIGTRGRTGLSRILLGSVAEKIIRHAPCSVLAVHPSEEVRPFTHALCPIDFSEAGQQVLTTAMGLVRSGGAGITLLHVLEAPVPYSGELQEPELLRDLDARTAEHLETWAAALRDKAAVPVTARCRVGWPGAEILAALEHDASIDLVVVGSHGRTGLKRALLGSVSEKVVRHARCPVLVARSRA